VVIDLKSGQGYVCLQQRGTIMAGEKRIATGPDKKGYEYLEIREDQGFFVFGSAAVLYVYHD
jgi:hypothetical protein